MPSVKNSLGSLSGAARAYILGIIMLGVLVAAYCVADLVRHPVGPQWLVLVGLTIASGFAMLRIPAMPISFSISDTFNIAAALLFGPSAGAITAGLDGLVLSARMLSTSRSIDRILFNTAGPMVSLWISSQVFFALGGNNPIGGPLSALRLLALLTLFGALDFCLNSGIVAAAVSFERRQPILSIWRDHLSGVWITYFGGTFGAMLLMQLARFGTIDITLILIIPLPVILYVAFRHAIGRTQDQISHLGTMNKVYIAAIEALAHAVDAKDQVTHDHTRRVQDQTVRLARALEVEDESEIQAINAAALLHDVGKLAIPEHILNKPGRLTPAEFEIMKRHAPIGADILAVIGLPYAVAPIVRHHHESWDGSGYPDGLTGDRIPIGSRIIAVVDCFDALTSDRPYRPRMEDRDAFQILSDRKGKMYDPRVVDAFVAMHSEGTVAADALRAPDNPALIFLPLPQPVEPIAPQPVERDDDGRDDADLQTFFNLGRALGGAASASQLGEILWCHLRPHLPASTFVLYGYVEADDTIVAVHTAGDSAGEVEETPVPLGDRLSGWVAATGQTVMNSDARLDLDESSREHSPLRSALAVPIVSNGRTAGVLTFYAEASNAFGDDHRRLIEAAGRAVAGSVPALARYLAVVQELGVPKRHTPLQNSNRR
jgi:putative nucleotidyltransferase with HDIG domain